MDNHFKPTDPLSRDLFRYVWRTSRSKQIVICVVTMVLAPLMLVPLELQRRIVDHALVEKNVLLLAELSAAYLAIVCLQGGLKYWLNMIKGAAIETIARDLRIRILGEVRDAGANRSSQANANAGMIVAMLAAETEDVSGFGGDAFGVPLLAGGTILYVAVYLLWVEPKIALLAVFIYFPQAVIVPVTQRTINRLARLRIQTVRNLGHFAAEQVGLRSTRPPTATGRSLVDRIFMLRIAIYFRKYVLAALGNFLDSLGSIIVLLVGGYLVIQGTTGVGTLVVFMSGLGKIADPWDQLINFYRSVSNTAVMFDMIRTKIGGRTT